MLIMSKKKINKIKIEEQRKKKRGVKKKDFSFNKIISFIYEL